MSLKRPSLTIIIHTKNEENNIAACIQSCGEIAQKILVVDMYSHDSTVKIARKMGAQIMFVPNSGFVEPARQKAIDSTKTEWIFLLDADERLTPRLRKTILRLLLSHDHDIVKFPRKNFILKEWSIHGMHWPDYQVRLFRKKFLHWPKIVHAQPIYKQEQSMKLAPTEANAIVHFHTSSIEQLLQKTWQQATHETFYDKQKNLTPRQVMKRIEREFPWRFYEHHGFRDGMPGYISAKFMEYYRFLEFAVYWEKHPKLFSNQKQVKEFGTFSQRSIALQQKLDTIKQITVLRANRLLTKILR